MNDLGWLILTAGLLFGAIFFYVLAMYLNDRAEDRAAAYEFRHAPPARTFRVALPYLADGSYHRAAPRRTGPLYPIDFPGPAAPRPERAPAAGLLTARTPGEARAADRAGESPVAAPGWCTGRAATRPEAVPILSPPPAITSVPGRVPTQESPARPGTTSLPGTAVSGGRTHTPHPQGERSPAATTYDQLLAMATAVNDAWLDRLFAGAA